MARRRRRYSWALQFSPGSTEVQRLSREAREGLTFATLLAESARESSRAALSGDPHEPVTVARIAAEEELSPVAVNTCIKHARVELFGRDLSDSAIYYRLRRRRTTPSEHLCLEPQCTNRLPLHATARRRYCREHASPSARTRRHRRASSAAQ